MFYIPKDWLKDRNNEQVVRDILEKHLGNSDLIAEGFENDVELAFKELEAIGETENKRRNIEKLLKPSKIVFKAF
jgi:hypothetical protein